MRMEAKTEKKTFLSGVLLLSVSTILVKIVGLIYKIPMLSYLGAEGMGYFNSAYEIYALFCVIATAGLPVALSVLISAELAKGNETRVAQLFRAALFAFVVIGLFGTAFMAAFSSLFCRMIQSENARLCILSISPTVFLICISSALRGFFQGYGSMLQTAISQLIEAVGKLGFGLFLAQAALKAGKETHEVAAAAGVGLTLGTLASLLYLLIEKNRFRTKIPQNTAKNTDNTLKMRSVWRSLAKLAVPITLGASAVNLTKLIDMTMILRRLQSIGYSEILANQAYGSYTTLALSVYGLLPTLVNSIALPLVPLLSAAIASGNRERQSDLVRTSYRLTAMFAIPSALGLAVYAKPILSLLFAREPESVAFAAPLLSMLGVSVFLSCMITATNSVLHAYRSVNLPILSLLAGSVVKVIVAYILIGNPRVGILGAPISSLACNAVVVLLNLIFAERLCSVSSLWQTFCKPLAIATVAVGISYGGYRTVARYASDSFATLAALGIAALLFFLLSFVFGGFSEEDLRSLPMGKKLLYISEKICLNRKRKEVRK